MIKLWKCVYIVEPKNGGKSRSVDYVWSEKHPRQYVSYCHTLFECNSLDFTAQEVEPNEGMIINIKAYDLPETDEE